MLGARLGVALAALACVLVKLDKTSRRTLGVDKILPAYNDAGCELLETGTAVEDLTLLGDGHCAFGGGGDLGRVFAHGVGGEVEGAIWLVNATARTLREVAVDWAGHARPRLVFHGAYYSQRSRRLYLVNHDGSKGGGDSVEVFSVVDVAAPLVRHEVSVRPSAADGGFVFPPYAMNDVVEGQSIDEIYVTQWLPFGFFAGGTEEAGWHQGWRRWGAILAAALQLPLTRVYRCSVAGSARCVAATSRRFVGANGIAVSPDRRTFYIADPPGGTLTALTRDDNDDEDTASGGDLLRPVRTFKTRHAVDNTECLPDGTLACGTIPLPFTAPDLCKVGLGRNGTIQGRPAGCGASPGTLLRVEPSTRHSLWNQTDLLVHDGSKLGSTSAALPVGDAFLLSGPYNTGVLLCENKKNGAATTTTTTTTNDGASS